MSRSHLSLAAAERTALQRLAHTAAPAYLRERAAAILKVATGQSATQVAREGLLQPRKVETVCRWLVHYRSAGVAGLAIRPGRGRTPAFSPQQPTAPTARAALLDLIRREPRQFGLPRGRWRLDDVLAHLADWGWRLHRRSGLSRLLRRVRISFTQGRSHVHSPDLNDAPKRQDVQTRQLAAHLAAQEAGWLD